MQVKRIREGHKIKGAGRDMDEHKQDEARLSKLMESAKNQTKQGHGVRQAEQLDEKCVSNCPKHNILSAKLCSRTEMYAKMQLAAHTLKTVQTLRVG